VSKSKKQYLLELGGAFTLYAVLLVASIVILNKVGIESPTVFRIVVALIPMVAIVFIMRAAMRFFRRMDELEKRMQLDSLAFAFVGTAFVTFGYGFLEIVGMPRISMFVVWPLMAVLWMIGHALARRYYGGDSHDE
jgi:hypothetical protein